MLVIDARNVNDAWTKAIPIIKEKGVARPSRYGPVLEYPAPVTTVYEKPWERVLFDSTRDANPFFHLFEALWMLSGRNDVAWLARFLPRMAEFSDDGLTFHGAYGYRWLQHFDMYGGGDEDETDQLGKIIRMLSANKDERRAVLQMWDPVADLGRNGKDLPCNTAAYFKVRDGKLEMTVTCRSNDIILGCLGANAVHFSILHEYMAALTGYPQGRYFQVSDSWHMYTETSAKFFRSDGSWEGDPYALQAPHHPALNIPLFEYEYAPALPFSELRNLWGRDLAKFISLAALPELTGIIAPFQFLFFNGVAAPMLSAFNAWKSGDIHTAMDIIRKRMVWCDWKIACTNWLGRRLEKQAGKR